MPDAGSRLFPRLIQAVDRGGNCPGGGGRGGGSPPPRERRTPRPPHPARPFGAPPSPPGRGQCVAMVTGKTCPRSRPFSGNDDCPQTNQQYLKSPFVSLMERYSLESPYLTLVCMGSPHIHGDSHRGPSLRRRARRAGRLQRCTLSARPRCMKDLILKRAFVEWGRSRDLEALPPFPGHMLVPPHTGRRFRLSSLPPSGRERTRRSPESS